MSSARRCFLVGAQNGLYWTDLRSSVQLVPGDIYGVTYDEAYVYYAKREGQDPKGSTTLYRNTLPRLLDGEPPRELFRYAWGGHQIDVTPERLYITDTCTNRLVVACRKPGRLFFDGSDTVIESYPAGVLEGNRKQAGNYRHFNSVFTRGDRLYLVAHNLTQRSRRASTLWVTDDLDGVSNWQEYKLPGEPASCHNFVKYAPSGVGFLFCNSLHGRVQDDASAEWFIKAGTFPRGLSVADGSLFVGYSIMKNAKELRGQQDGSIVEIGDLETVEFTLKGAGQIFEIRCVSHADFGMSFPQIIGNYCEIE